MERSVHAIILAARGVKCLPGQRAQMDTSLEWLVHAFRENGIEQITVIGGKNIDRMAEEFPGVHFLYNPQWRSTHTLASLYLAREQLCAHDCIACYGDTVFRPGFIKALLAGKRGDVSVVVDRQWRERYPGRARISLVKAEKAYADAKGSLHRAARKTTDFPKVTGEFTGVLYLTREGGRKVVELCGHIQPPERFHEAPDLRRAGFTDMLQKLLDQKESVYCVYTDGEWAEMDTVRDFGRFLFGTKAQTLERLRPVLKSGIILPQYSFTVADWKRSPANVLRRVQQHFAERWLVVRSSSKQEDSLQASAAGKFTSVLAVDREDAVSLRRAVITVVKSFGRSATSGDQVMVQPQVRDVMMSGVVFTCDIKSGAPYYVINYDTSGSTDSVTGGKGGEQHLHYLYRGSSVQPKDKRLRALLRCVRDLERLAGNRAVDIEFAVDRRGRVIIFQTRPITSSEALANFFSYDIQPCISRAKSTAEQFFQPKPSLAGATTVLGDMPDWNPAELIGSHPRPLSSSIFDHLIGREAWRRARALLGYFDPVPERLIQMIAGHPYVDVRCSLNSYTPASLDHGVRAKVVDEALAYLRTHPSSHDKLEFEVATTCFTPFFPERIARWKASGLTQREISAFADSLRAQTTQIIRGERYSPSALIGMVRTLDQRRKAMLAKRDRYLLPDLVEFLLDDCAELGTVPFSSLARMAFIGSTFLRAFLSRGAISEGAYHGFLRSITTVAGEMGHALECTAAGALPLRKFLEEYGHLRPGTYEITSLRYDEKPDLYFRGIASTRKQQGASHKKAVTPFRFSPSEQRAMQRALDAIKLQVPVADLLRFIAESIQGRELAKFLFSRNVSDALSLMVEWGGAHGIDRDTLSFLTLAQFSLIASTGETVSRRDRAFDAAQAAQAEYLLHQQVIMPQLIFSPDDIEFVAFQTSRPNFITAKAISGEAVHLDGRRRDISGKIVLIESADPGYDWIFTHQIAGLITKYGGAASHMAIRAAEFGLPAAIGVGSKFEALTARRTIHLDCANHTIS